MAHSGSLNPTHFEYTKVHWMVLITIGFGLYSWAIFSPETFPYTFFGPIGTIVKYFVEHHDILFKIGYYGSWTIHVIEAFVSFWIFRAKGITDPVAQLKWFVQTIFFGFGSFGLLLAYNPQKKK